MGSTSSKAVKSSSWVRRFQTTVRRLVCFEESQLPSNNISGPIPGSVFSTTGVLPIHETGISRTGDFVRPPQPRIPPPVWHPHPRIARSKPVLRDCSPVSTIASVSSGGAGVPRPCLPRAHLIPRSKVSAGRAAMIKHHGSCLGACCDHMRGAATPCNCLRCDVYTRARPSPPQRHRSFEPELHLQWPTSFEFHTRCLYYDNISLTTPSASDAYQCSHVSTNWSMTTSHKTGSSMATLKRPLVLPDGILRLPSIRPMSRFSLHFDDFEPSGSTQYISSFLRMHADSLRKPNPSPEKDIADATTTREHNITCERQHVSSYVSTMRDVPLDRGLSSVEEASRNAAIVESNLPSFNPVNNGRARTKSTAEAELFFVPSCWDASSAQLQIVPPVDPYPNKLTESSKPDRTIRRKPVPVRAELEA